MKILIVGTDATGGYFGGRMLQAGLNVTFLARPSSAALLQASGLNIRSPLGDATLKPRVISWLTHSHAYDVIFLCCKAHNLEDAMSAMGPAVGEQTMIVPVLEGLRHLELLDARFGARHVLGGLCSIAVVRSHNGDVDHLGSVHLLRFGERDGSMSPRVTALETELQDVNLNVKASRNIIPSLWEKWALLAGLASMNCLMRADLTAILKAPGGRELCLQMLDECSQIAAANGFPPRPQVLEDVRSFLDTPSGIFKSSMLLDLELGKPTEADHIIGDLLARAAAKNVPTPLLRIAYCHLMTHQQCTHSSNLQRTYNTTAHRRLPATPGFDGYSTDNQARDLR